MDDRAGPVDVERVDVDDVEAAVASLLKGPPEVVNSVLSSSTTLAELLSLPDILNEEKLRIAAETESLVYENYTTFLKLAVNVSKTRKSINETKVLQSSLQEDVKQLEVACTLFASQSAAIAEKRETTKSMIKHFPQILELLEVPQLIDACIRSRSYDRALELLQLARKTLGQHRIPLLEDVMLEVKAAADLMKEQILQQLSSDCDMETTIRSVDHLRRLDVDGDELELRVRFLQVREQWMESGKMALPAAQLGRWLMGCAERLRTDLFFIVTQYNTLFAGECVGGSHLLWAFAFRKVMEFVEVLEAKLPGVSDGEEMGAILEQVMYTGASLARAGLDFRLAVLALAERSVIAAHRRRLHAASFFFSESLRAHPWRLDDSADQGTSEPGTSQALDEGPPLALLRHPPLALFANDLLDALNQLRYCALLSVSETLHQLLKETLLSAHQAVDSWSRALTGKQQAVCENMKTQLAELSTYIEAKQKQIFVSTEQENQK